MKTSFLNPPNFRFWQFVNNNWVKLTLRPGQVLKHAYGGPSDEGYSWTQETWELSRDGKIVTKGAFADDRDCDGRHRSRWLGEFNIQSGEMIVPGVDLGWRIECNDCHGYMFESSIRVPRFEEVETCNYDAFAEAAGY